MQAVGRFDPRDFWLVSSRRAVMAASIAAIIDPSARAESFTAALLQDMALPVLAANLEAYQDVLERAHAPEHDLVTTETEQYGWHQGVVGGWMCARWEFPEPLAEAVTNHHGLNPQGPDLPIATAVSFISPSVEDAQLERTVDLINTAYGIPSDQIISLLETAELEAGEVTATFS